MIQQMIAIREQQKRSWNTFSPGWKHWDDFTMRFLQSQGDRIMEDLALQTHHTVLDIASGTGEPGLSIASRVKDGFVTAIDLSEGMLQIAREKAAAKGIKNFETQVSDVSELPFKDESFDAISCRLGFMFFPDMEIAAQEMVRVLKPGGKLALTVWGEPQHNLWITALVGAIKRNLEMPTPPAGAPGMFRCAQEGFMTDLFTKAGLSGGQESTILGKMHCHSFYEYWSFMNDVVPPIVAVFKDADPEIVKKIQTEVYDLLNERIPGEEKDISFGARFFKAQKAS